MFKIATSLVILLGLTSPLAAGPCTNNNWQPTFVHDLDNEDGPYYVTPNSTFVKLRWEQNGGYVANACELVRGPQDTRNPRGFTTCREYTRIQCGCTRSIPGNDTCAAFLRWHPASPPVPGPGPTATGLVNISPGMWLLAPQYHGVITRGSNSIVLHGGAWTNGRLKNGVYDGNRIFSTEIFDFSAGGDAYMQFSVNAGGRYLALWPRVLEGVSVHFVTTEHAWDRSVIVPENQPLFAHLRVEPGGAYRITLATGAYDNGGGSVVNSNTGRLANPRGRLEMLFGDNYVGVAASITITEAMVDIASAAAPPPPPDRGNGAGLPGGAACSRESDCASSLCLLGVCAPAQ